MTRVLPNVQKKAHKNIKYSGILKPWFVQSNGNQVYQVVWSWNLWWFGPYFVYRALILNDATILTLTRNRLLSFIMVTKCTKLYDPEANGLFSILPKRIFLLSNATTFTFAFWPWKRKGFFLSWWWLSVPSCVILELTFLSLYCLHAFSTE
jgi:hypothetical protein